MEGKGSRSFSKSKASFYFLLFYHKEYLVFLIDLPPPVCKRLYCKIFFSQGLRRLGRDSEEESDREGTKDFHALSNFYVVLGVD